MSDNATLLLEILHALHYIVDMIQILFAVHLDLVLPCHSSALVNTQMCFLHLYRLSFYITCCPLCIFIKKAVPTDNKYRCSRLRQSGFKCWVYHLASLSLPLVTCKSKSTYLLELMRLYLQSIYSVFETFHKCLLLLKFLTCPPTRSLLTFQDSDNTYQGYHLYWLSLFHPHFSS